MRIKSLHIKDKTYKNLDIELNGNAAGVMAFIGNNGSGKSNLLEALSVIFHHLYQRKEKDIPFDFSLTYQIGSANQIIQITKRKTSVISQINDRTVSDVYANLPKQIIAIYSGEEDRLWKKCYRPLYLEYISNITSGKTTGLGVYNEMPRMLYINKFYWHISLLCLLLQQLYNSEDNFCMDILNIKKVNSIKFVFNKKNYENYQDSQVKSFINIIDKKQEYSLQELKELIDENNFSLIDVFKFLYIAFTPDNKKMLENIIIKYNDENLEIEDFSEGEKKMLLIKAALEFAGLEDSLFLLDEPDSHIHLNNKVQIKKVFETYKDNRQVILTTHSPTLTDSLEEEGLFMLDSGKLIPHKKKEILESVSGEFWNKFQQNAFIASRKLIILLVEGKHDKEHIENAHKKLIEEYKDVEFDVFVLNGESKIQPFLSGLYESDFYTNKTYIGIYDNDVPGNNTFGKNFEKIENREFKKLFENNTKPNQSYYAARLPKPDGISCDCTIETLYDSEKFLNALNGAYQQSKDLIRNKSIDDISKDIKESAKNILSIQSSEFNKEDFKNFRKLFDLIREIKQYADDLKITQPSEIIEESEIEDTKEPEVKKTEASGEIDFVEIYLEKFGIKATGLFFNGKNVTIKAGSTISGTTTPSYTGKPERKRQLRRYCKKQEDGNYLLQSDIEFNTPSGAIKFVVGSNLNGWDYWLIRENGRKLQTIRYKK